MQKSATFIITLTSVVVASFFFISTAEAKSITSTVGYPTIIAGPCALEWADNLYIPNALGTEYIYPLPSVNFPGGVNVDIVNTGTLLYAKNVCMEPGWTMEYKVPSGGGMDIRFLYNGVRAIDFQYIWGSTKIKMY